MNIASIKNITAIGAGAMGACTALSFAMGGYAVKLYDLNDTGVATAADIDLSLC